MEMPSGVADGLLPRALRPVTCMSRGVCVRARVRLRLDYASSMCRAIVIASRPFILRLADSKKPAKKRAENGPSDSLEQGRMAMKAMRRDGQWLLMMMSVMMPVAAATSRNSPVSLRTHWCSGGGGARLYTRQSSTTYRRSRYSTGT